MNPTLVTRLQESIKETWQTHGFFPCYAAVLPAGDVDFRWRDLWRFSINRSAPILRLATLLLWPARLLQGFQNTPKGGSSQRVSIHGRATLRFHTFFTDFYFYLTIRKILQATLPNTQRKFWEQICLNLVETALNNQEYRTLSGQTFTVYSFFPRKELHKSANANARRFLRWSGLENIDPDADDTFVLLEMLADFLAWLQTGGLPWLETRRRMRLRSDIERILDLPYWKIARAYQIQPGQKPINYTDVQPVGGVSTWFSVQANDAPDLVVNVNVLRALLVNRIRWGTLEIPEALETTHGILDFLAANVISGLFRQPRGYSFYLPEFFVAMFGQLWQVWQTLSPQEQTTCDPHNQMPLIRSLVLDYLGDKLHPQRTLNPLDAALALGASRSLGAHQPTWISGWLRILEKTASPQGRPYPAYEIFKGKIPTRMVYGSPAMTAAFALAALMEIDYNQ